jgi:hypothetical protein
LDRVGDTGVVHGIDLTDDMLRRAGSRFGRDVREIAAALQNSCLQVEQRRIDEKPMPRYLFIGRRA